MATIQNKVNLSSFTSAGLNTGVDPSSLYPGLETFYDDQASQHIIGLMIYVIKLARVLTEYIIRTGKEGVEKNLLKSIMKIFWFYLLLLPEIEVVCLEILNSNLIPSLTPTLS